jgi:hypothetical protein
MRGSVVIFRSQSGSAGERVWETLKLNCIQGFNPVPRSRHSISVVKTDHSLLYREIICLYSEIHSKHGKRAV